MQVKMRFLSECSATGITGKGTFTRVSSFVNRQAVAVPKSCLTLLTLERLVPGVNTHMGLHGRLLGESKVTLLTLEWPLPTMSAEMEPEGSASLER